MTITAEQGVVRILSKMDAFAAKGKVDTPITLRADERVLGVYRADDPDDTRLVVTTAGLHRVTAAGDQVFLPYREIAEVSLPANKLPPPTEFDVVTAHGRRVSIPVVASVRSSDAFEWARFLDRIRETLTHRRATEKWTHPSVLLYAAGSEPIAKIVEDSRRRVLSAIEEGWSGPPFDPIQLARLWRIDVTPRSDIL